MTDAVIPNFVCPGAQKAGTTSLYKILCRHQDIFLPVGKKEIHYFDRDINYERGLTWYAQHYAEAENQPIIGDISPDYMLFDYVPERIHKTLGTSVKFLFLLRNPVDRAFSQYSYHRFFQVEKNYSFEQALEADTSNVPARFASWHTPPYYIYKSCYFKQISHFLDFFGKENMHVSIFEDLFGADESRSRREIRDVFNFLGITASPDFAARDHLNPTFVPKNAALFDTIKGKIAPAAKRVLSKASYTALRKQGLQLLENKKPGLSQHSRHRMLNEYFLEDIRKLEDFVGSNLSVWYSQ